MIIPVVSVWAGGQKQPEFKDPEEAENYAALTEAAADNERSDECLAMLYTQIYERGIRDMKVLKAMARVERHRFVPENRQANAYADSPLPIGYGQTISQPFIVAVMTMLLNIGPDDRVLEIGTGSGYQAAVLSELCGEVYSVEIVKPLAERTRRLFDDNGYENIMTRRGDGYYGWEEAAPFDGIIVTAAAGHVPPPLIEQLAPGGRIVIPLGNPFRVQILTIVEKSMKGEIRTLQLMAVQFVPMTGTVEN